MSKRRVPNVLPIVLEEYIFNKTYIPMIKKAKSTIRKLVCCLIIVSLYKSYTKAINADIVNVTLLDTKSRESFTLPPPLNE